MIVPMDKDTLISHFTGYPVLRTIPSIHSLMVLNSKFRNQYRRFTKQFVCVAAVCLAVPTMGCIGPRGLTATRLKYNEAIRRLDARDVAGVFNCTNSRRNDRWVPALSTLISRPGSDYSSDQILWLCIWRKTGRSKQAHRSPIRAEVSFTFELARNDGPASDFPAAAT